MKRTPTRTNQIVCRSRLTTLVLRCAHGPCPPVCSRPLSSGVLTTPVLLCARGPCPPVCSRPMRPDGASSRVGPPDPVLVPRPDRLHVRRAVPDLVVEQE